MHSTARLMIVAALVLGGCGGRDVAENEGGAGDGTALPDGSSSPDGSSAPDGAAPQSCPTDPQQGASCNVPSAVECPSMDYMAFSCGLQTCQCKGGSFDCTPYSPTSGAACDPFAEGDSCGFEGNPGCGQGEPVGGSASCKNGKWVHWTACHPECPMAYSDDLPGTPCSFTPDEGACYWDSYISCTCRDGKFDCS